LRTARGLFLCGGALLLLIGCARFLTLEDLSKLEVERADSILLVVESGLCPAISDSIDTYRQDLRKEGCDVRFALWEGGGARELRAFLRSSMESGGVHGAFLVGELPAAWYEQPGFTGHEEFPCDLYFMDFDARWEDRDGDGVLDAHSTLSLDMFVSRIEGTDAEISRYFEKVHRYRTGELTVWKGAYIFKDDDWADFHRGSSFELSRIYGDVDVCEDVAESFRSAYVAKLSGTGAEYVFQWIHSYPHLLCVRGAASYEYIHTSDVAAGNFKGVFYNLFDCSAARFTEENLGAAYLLRTDYGLAVLGSTKVGGNYYPRVFHYALAQGARWGDAYKCWYNEYGALDDKWFMGMVILGDPMLTLTEEARGELKALAEDAAPPSLEEIGALEDAFRRFGYENTVLGFAEYRSRNSRFFE
jgi:hypothetical protein